MREKRCRCSVIVLNKEKESYSVIAPQPKITYSFLGKLRFWSLVVCVHNSSRLESVILNHFSPNGFVCDCVVPWAVVRVVVVASSSGQHADGLQNTRVRSKTTQQHPGCSLSCGSIAWAKSLLALWDIPRLDDQRLSFK
jgi:hypothetical protein